MIDPSDIHNENSDAEIKGSCHSVDTDDCPIVIEKTFNKVFFPTIYEDRTSSVLFLELREYARSKCLPTRQCSVSYIKILFPFWSWLKTYEIAWLPNDIVSGITVLLNLSISSCEISIFIFLRLPSCKFHKGWLMLY